MLSQPVPKRGCNAERSEFRVATPVECLIRPHEPVRRLLKLDGVDRHTSSDRDADLLITPLASSEFVTDESNQSIARVEGGKDHLLSLGSRDDVLVGNKTHGTPGSERAGDLGSFEAVRVRVANEYPAARPSPRLNTRIV